jgi:protein arginine kinase activator
MLCSECGQSEATVFFKALIGYRLLQANLCEPCAERKGLEVMGQPAPLLFGLLSLLSGSAFGRPRKPVRACPACGLEYETFRKTGRLGCAACYESFEAPLAALLAKIHGAEVHIGKHPPRPAARSWGAQPASSEPRESAKPPEGARQAPRPDFEVKKVALTRRSPPSGETGPAKKERIAILEGRLQQLLKQEDYEAAARLRDELRRLRAEG